MNDRKLDNILAAALALAFAAFAAGGVLYLRTFDGAARPQEEKHSSDIYIGLGQPEKADAYGLHYHQSLGVAGEGAVFLGIAGLSCAAVILISLWVVPVHRRALRSNPPRAPAY